MPKWDELLEDEPESQAFDAVPDVPGFDPEETVSAVVTVEPPIIHIGRAKRSDELRRMQQQSSDTQRGN